MLIYPLLILLCIYAKAVPLSIDGDMFDPLASKTMNSMRRAAREKKVVGKENDDLSQVPGYSLNSSNHFQQSKVKKMPKLPHMHEYHKHESFMCKAKWCSRGCERGPNCCAEAMFNMLNATSALLRKHNIDHFVWAGTLLGGFRGHDIIQKDNDIDLVISEQGIKFLLHQTEIPYRFFWDNKGGGLMRGCQMFKDANSVAIPNDIHYLYKPNLIYMDVYPLQTWAVVVHTKQHLGSGYRFHPHTQISIRDESFPGPKDPESVLIDLYGPNWQTPSSYHAGTSMPSWRPHYLGVSILVLLMLLILCATLKTSPNSNANQSTAATLVWQSTCSLAERFAIMMTIFGLSVDGLGSHRATEQEKTQPESHQQHQNAPASPTSEVTAEASGASAASPSWSSEVTNEPAEPVQASPALTSEALTS